MRHPRSSEHGFTLVELMTVVLIIGILVTIAVPVYDSAATQARARSCQANQRTIEGAVGLYMSGDGSAATASAGQFAVAGSGWYGLLVPGWIKVAPLCPLSQTNYLLAADGSVVGDNENAVGWFNPDHQIQ